MTQQGAGLAFIPMFPFCVISQSKWLRAIFCRPTDIRVLLIITSNSAQKQRSTSAEMPSWWSNDFIYGLLILQVIQLTFDQAELISSRHFWASTQCANVGVQANIRGSLAEHYCMSCNTVSSRRVCLRRIELAWKCFTGLAGYQGVNMYCMCECLSLPI